MRTPSQTFGYSAVSAGMTYTVYGGVASASGTYTARVYPVESFDMEYTLTAVVNGETAWVEEGQWFRADGFPSNDDPPMGTFFVTLDPVPAC